MITLISLKKPRILIKIIFTNVILKLFINAFSYNKQPIFISLAFPYPTKILIKFNTMVDGAVTMTGNMGKSFENLGGVSEGVKAVFSLFKLFSTKKEKKREEE